MLRLSQILDVMEFHRLCGERPRCDLHIAASPCSTEDADQDASAVDPKTGEHLKTPKAARDTSI